ncbi:conserved hypothetical protein [Tenacibaculum litopenaei]|uniref:hypothetical protein n=1 Tax=Tenacibaculum litopenaei TaxID=396016 RepID=UPI00389547DF
MHKQLYFICPTDCLEPLINKSFSSENYFYTSLGNSIASEIQYNAHLLELIKIKNIKKIRLVLSDENRLVLEALAGINYNGIQGVSHFAKEFHPEQQEYWWNSQTMLLSVLSSYLRKVIARIHQELPLTSTIDIKGLIYQRTANRFLEIYPEFLCLKKRDLN